MSSKKKVIQKAPAAKFKLSQRLYTIVYHKSKPEEIWEVKVGEKIQFEGKFDYIIGPNKVFVSYNYKCLTPNGTVTEFIESSLYPSFQQAANAFAKAFLVQRPL